VGFQTPASGILGETAVGNLPFPSPKLKGEDNFGKSKQKRLQQPHKGIAAAVISASKTNPPTP